MANYPNTKQLGSVIDIDTSKLPQIDLLIGGSPCQSFSFAGKRNGMSTKDNIEILTLEHYLELKEQKYQFEGQSYLFWEYIRVLKEVKPKYFLLENVMMTEKWQKIITNAIGVKPIKINSSLVSAQNRKRLYWTNIGLGKIEQPKDSGIYIRDILEDNVDEKYYLSEFKIEKIMKYGVIFPDLNSKKVKQVNASKESGNKQPYQQNRVYDTNGISPALCANKSNLLILGADFRYDVGIRWRKNGKSPTLTTRASSTGTGISGQPMVNYPKLRTLTPIEVERLQNVPDNYTNHVSDTQRYRMLGNGWTVEVIAHIFNYINK
jgi:DNA (cytosine-5)-methyltransferase 3A